MIAALHSGTIRKKPDAVSQTQAEAISLKKKLEQEKDGKKEAPMPSFQLYGGKGFLAKTPVDSSAAEQTDLAAPSGSEQDEGLGLDFSDFEDSEEGEDPGFSADSEEAEDEEDWWAEETENSFKESAPEDEVPQ